MTTYEITTAIIVLAICAVLYYLPKTEWWKKHINDVFTYKDPCWGCNKGSCTGCLVLPVKSAYVQKLEYGKVVASSTLTFRDDFVISQSPAGGNEQWDVPNFVGCYKTEVARWIDDNSKAPIENHIGAFS